MRAWARPAENARERTGSLTLRAPTVHGNGTEAEARELFGESVCAAPRPGEHDRAARGVDDVGRVLHPVAVLNEPEVMPGIDGLRLDRTGIVAHRVLLVVTAQHGDVPVERGREQQGLALACGAIEDAAHRRQEAHVGHPVCLVDDDDVDGAEVDAALLHEVFEPAGCCDEHVDSPAQRVLLGAVANAAVDGEDVTFGRLGERSELALDLLGELTSWREDERSWPLAVGAADSGEHGKAEGEGLARPGGSLAAHVSAREDVGYGGGLNRERFDDVSLRKGADEGVGKPELGERGGHDDVNSWPGWGRDGCADVSLDHSAVMQMGSSIGRRGGPTG